MASREFVKKFSIENISLFTSKKFDKKLIKDAKRKYFIDRLKNEFGSPHNREIAETIIEQFLSIKKFTNLEDLKKFIYEHDFFKAYIHNIEKFESKFEEVKPPLSVDEIIKLKRDADIEIERRRIKKDIIRQSTKDIDEAIKRKRKEYLSIPSIVDQSEVEEIEVIENAELEEKLEWWEKLNLISNPFKVQEGLSQIPQDLYDEVVLKTPIYTAYLNRAINNVDELLFKGRPLIGDFGSGKSTLIDYISFALTEYDIKVFRITLLPRADAFTLNVALENKLFEKMGRFFRDRFQYDYSGGANIHSIVQMSKQLQDTEEWSFVVAIDDLHKMIGGEDIVMKFLASLQIIKDTLTREGVRIGFLVSGLPEWQDRLKTDGALKGFLDSSPDFMPEVTPEIAYEVIKKRFRAFSKNPDINNFIDLNFLKQIHRKTINDGFRGFKTYMSNIETELKDRGNFNIFESNPMDISDEILNKIRGLIDSNENLRTIFNKFVYGSGIKSAENRDLGLRVLIKIYLDHGIYDEDDFVRINIFHFKKLSDSNLINKLTTNKGETMWVANPIIIEFNKKTMEKYNLSMEDYLRPLYSVPFKKKSGRTSPAKKNRFEEFIGENSTQLVDFIKPLEASLFPYQKAINLNSTKIRYTNIPRLLNEWKTSLTQVSMCIFQIENLVEANDIALNLWETYWDYPEYLKKYSDELSKFGQEIDQIPRLKMLYIEAYKQLFELFIDNFEINKRFHMGLANLTEQEIKLFYNCRKLFISSVTVSNYYKLLAQLNEHLESKIRNVLRTFFNLLYGGRKNRLGQIKENEILGYIQKDSRIYEKHSFNEFQNLNRGQYRKLFLELPHLGKAIFKPVFGKNYVNELTEFFETFGDYNIITSHNKSDSVDTEDQSRIYSYIIKSAKFVKDLNIAFRKFTYEYYYIKEETESEVISYFSLRGLKDEKIKEKIYILGDNLLKEISDITSVTIKKEDIERIYDTLANLSKETDCYYLDLESYVLIEKLFTINYRDFMAILAYLRFKNIILIEDKFGCVILLKILKSI